MLKKGTFKPADDHDLLEWRMSPYQILAIGFAFLILMGTSFLMLPEANVTGEPMGFVDALFTVTSAVCVTGLTVVDTGTYFTTFGQMIIILLIQIGGLGITTMATIMALLIRRRLQLRDRLILQESLNQLTIAGVVRLVIYIIKATLLIEFIGGTILAIRFYADFGVKGIYYGYWHAVSGFCNAGFDIIGAPSGNMTRYVDDPVVNIVVPVLIILGGLGFTVIADIWENRSLKKISFHTQIVLATTAFLLTIGTVGIFCFEYGNPDTMESLSLPGKLMASFFQSTTARTAGFTTLSVIDMYHDSLVLLMVLMFVGASPCSMAGGIKTTTFAVIALSIWTQLRGGCDTVVFRGRISEETINKSITIFFVSLMVVGLIDFCITIIEPSEKIAYLWFEVISAFSTTGIELGITTELHDFSKLLLVAAMYIGRVGPVTFAMALMLRGKKQAVRYPEKKITIG